MASGVGLGGLKAVEPCPADVIATSHDDSTAQNSMKATFRKSRLRWIESVNDPFFFLKCVCVVNW